MRDKIEPRRLIGLVLALLLLVAVPAGSKTGERTAAVVDGPIHDGVEVQIDLPESQHVRNFAAPRDGLGLCVFATLTMQARWHNLEPLFDAIKTVEYGGGWPEKVDEVVKKCAPNVTVVHYEGTDPAILDRALAEGKAVGVTYGYGERYRGTIYHMVLLVYLDEGRAAILDNNFPGTYEWMSRDEFLRRWTHASGYGWADLLLAPPPVPVPKN